MNEKPPVPALIVESIQAKDERIIKRLFTIIIVLIILSFATITGVVAGFLYYESVPAEEVSIDNDSGNANYIGNGNTFGDINNGKNNSEEAQ